MRTERIKRNFAQEKKHLFTGQIHRLIIFDKPQSPVWDSSLQVQVERQIDDHQNPSRV